LVCSDCKTVNKPDWKFCSKCGGFAKTDLVKEDASSKDTVLNVRPSSLVPVRRPSKAGSVDGSDNENEGCLTCDAPVEGDSFYCLKCGEFEAAKKKAAIESGEGGLDVFAVPFKSARGVTASPFLKRFVQEKASSTSSMPAISPRRAGSSLAVSTLQGSLSGGISRTGSNQGLSGTSALLKWLQKRIAPNRPRVVGWKTGWNDGLVFCALAEFFFPKDVVWDSLSTDCSREGKQANCEIAFMAFEKGGVPRLLEPEDLIDAEVAEPRSLQTYISEIRKRLDPHPDDSPAPSPVITTRKRPDLTESDPN